MLLGMEDMLEGQALLGFAGTKPGLELLFVAAQAIESYELRQSGLHLPSAFGVDILAQASDLQSLLEGSLLNFAEKDVDCLFPLPQPLFAFRHRSPTQLRLIPLLACHALPPFRAMVPRTR